MSDSKSSPTYKTIGSLKISHPLFRLKVRIYARFAQAFLLPPLVAALYRQPFARLLNGV
jgi:hypothetical protein